MKPHVICHMASSLDGRILPDRWRPQGFDVGPAYERMHDAFEGDAWLIGRVTGAEYAKAASYPRTSQTFARDPFFARRDADSLAVVVDAHGRIAWGRADIGGDPILVLLTTSVSDDHLAGLRADGVSYLFAGETELDLAAALEQLNAELGVKRLLLEGGGAINGAFLRAGLIDEISVILCPAIDGAAGAPGVFDGEGGPAPLSALSLIASEPLDGGALWLRYEVTNPGA